MRIIPLKRNLPLLPMALATLTAMALTARTEAFAPPSGCINCVQKAITLEKGQYLVWIQTTQVKTCVAKVKGTPAFCSLTARAEYDIMEHPDLGPDFLAGTYVKRECKTAKATSEKCVLPSRKRLPSKPKTSGVKPSGEGCTL